MLRSLLRHLEGPINPIDPPTSRQQSIGLAAMMAAILS